MIDKLADTGKRFCLEELTQRTTFDVIGKATFGHSLNAKSQGSAALEHWERMCRAFAKTHESYNFISNFFRLRAVKAEAKKLNAILAEMIKKRFNSVVQEKTDISGKKRLSIMDLALRDYVEESRELGRQVLDPAFLENSITQIKTLLAAGSGTTSNTICYLMMM